MESNVIEEDNRASPTTNSTLSSLSYNKLDDIDTIELKISEIVNQIDHKKSECVEESKRQTVEDSNLIEVIETQEDIEDDKARVALQQLESINSSSRRKKKPEIGSVVSTKNLHPSTIDNNDLIAILSGTAIEADKNIDRKSNSKEEVLIEGEGHFEVLEVEENDNEKLKTTENKIHKENNEEKIDLVSSLVNEWSEEEDNTMPKIPSTELKFETELLSNAQKNDLITADVKQNQPVIDKDNKITQFKRTRVIKRKIIWDPDAPETQFSYASLIQPKTKTSAIQHQTKLVTSPMRRKLVDRKAETVEKKPRVVTSTKKKKLSEIDRLLGDEGAANMLNSLEQQAEQSAVFENKSKRTVITKNKSSEQWDYVYNSTNVDSMIARRRSNSSYSSTTSPQRNSFDATPSNPSKPKANKLTEGNKKKVKNFEFAKPEAKKLLKNGDKNAQNYDIVSEIKKSVDKRNKDVPKKKSDDVVNVKKVGNICNIIVDTKGSKSKNLFTKKMLSRVMEVLNDLKNDDNCKVVLFSSSGQHFCQGLDFSELMNAEKKYKLCLEWSKIICEVFQMLITFPKPMVASVQGNVSGIGVMLLPMFDVTICSDRSVFETSYVKSGQYPECYSLFHYILNNSLVKRLIWLGEKISSSEAVDFGLITKTSSPQKVNEESINCAKKISSYSQEVYRDMKSNRFINISQIIDQLKMDELCLSRSISSNAFCESYTNFVSKGTW